MSIDRVSHDMLIQSYALLVTCLYQFMPTVSGVDFQSFEDGDEDQESPQNSNEELVTEGTTFNPFQEKKKGFVVPATEEEEKRSQELLKCKHPNCYWQGYDVLAQEDHEREYHAVAEAPQLFQRESLLDEETFKCKICKETFYYIGDLEDHLLEHEEENQKNVFGITITRTTLPPYEDIDLDLLIRSPSGKYLYCPLCSSKLYPINFQRHYAAHLKRGY